MSERKQGLSVPTVVLWAVLACLATGIVALAVWKKRQPPPAPPAERAVAVKVATVVPRSFADVRVLPGRVAADQDITLSAEKPGRAVEVAADKGDAVSDGQVLVRLDARLWEAARDRARVERADAERERDRLDRLKATGAVSQSDLDAATSRCAMAEVMLREAEVNMDQCVVRSPVDGLVEERWVEPGERVGEGQPLMRVVVVKPLTIEVDVPERDIGGVVTGGAVPFSAAGVAVGTLTGVVSFVASQAHPASNTFRVELTVRDAPAVLRPGMIVDVRLPRGESASAIVVPLHAVVPRKGDHMVFVVGEGDRAVSRLVRIGRIIGSSAVLDSGLAPGDRLVVEGQRMLQDGALLQVAAAE